MINKIKNLKFGLKNDNRGMTYVELIVVLTIFAILSAVAIFNYGAFQTKVDIKNLASDVALQIVQAQKSSDNGLLPPLAKQSLIVSPSTWRPAYGVYFNLTTDKKSLLYFSDLNSNNLFDNSDCTGECLNKITITKNDSISHLDVFYQGGTSVSLNDLTITFTRPDSSAVLKSSTVFTLSVSYVQITFASNTSTPASAIVKVYPSGRIQIN